MLAETRTSYETRTPWIYLEFVDARLALLQFHRVASADHDAFLADLMEALSAGYQEHTEQLMARLAQAYANRSDLERAEASAFMTEQRTRIKDASPPPPGRRFPTQADARDPSGAVHVSVAGDRVVILEVPAGMLTDHRSSGAIKAAFNLARERLDGDIAVFAGIDRFDSSCPAYAATITGRARPAG